MHLQILRGLNMNTDGTATKIKRPKARITLKSPYVDNQIMRKVVALAQQRCDKENSVLKK